MKTTSSSVPIGSGPRKEEEGTAGLVRSGMRALVTLTLAPTPLMRAGADNGQSGIPEGVETAAGSGVLAAGSVTVGETTVAAVGTDASVATGWLAGWDCGAANPPCDKML